MPHSVLKVAYFAIKTTAWLAALAWISRTLDAVFGLRRVPNLLRPGNSGRVPDGMPRATVIVPARDEQRALPHCLESLLTQDYPNLRIIAVNDRSTDQTPEILDSFAAKYPSRLSVLHVRELPPGWLGKTHAMALAARHAEATDRPEWLLFTDADVVFAPPTVRLALAEATTCRADHLVVPPSPILVGAGEVGLLGFFQLMGSWSVRLWRVPDPNSPRDVLGIGAFGLVRSSAYRQIGGFEALRLAVLDDMSLAQHIKAAGLRTHAAFGAGLLRLRWAEGALGLVRVLTKNMFALFAFRPVLLLAGCAGIVVLTIVPLLGLAIAGARLPSALALAGIAGMYVLLARYSRQPIWSFFFYPFGAVLLIYSLVRSMTVTLRQGGVIWRGTFYPLAELRRHHEMPH